MSSDTLVLVHMFARHGDRCPDSYSLYPNDPHKDKSFHPYGPGMLTNIGKKRMHTLGQQYRERYNNYLGELYLPEYLDTWSTEPIRARMSAQLFLSGLFPPNDELKWHEDLPWQPIPVNYIALERDTMLSPVVRQPHFLEAYYKHYASDHGKAALSKYSDIIPFIKEHTGLKEMYLRQLALVNDCLKVELEQGLPLPEWTEGIYPDKLKEVFSDEMLLHTATKELKKITCSEIFKKLLTDTQNKINNKSKTKMHLYIAHDINIAHVLIILGLWYPHTLKYASSLVLEVHKIDDKYGLKIFYKKSPDDDFDLMTFNKEEKNILWIEEFEKVVNDLCSDDNSKL